MKTANSNSVYTPLQSTAYSKKTHLLNNLIDTPNPPFQFPKSQLTFSYQQLKNLKTIHSINKCKIGKGQKTTNIIHHYQNNINVLQNMKQMFHKKQRSKSNNSLKNWKINTENNQPTSIKTHRLSQFIRSKIIYSNSSKPVKIIQLLPKQNNRQITLEQYIKTMFKKNKRVIACVFIQAQYLQTKFIIHYLPIPLNFNQLGQNQKLKLQSIDTLSKAFDIKSSLYFYHLDGQPIDQLNQIDGSEKVILVDKFAKISFNHRPQKEILQDELQKIQNRIEQFQEQLQLGDDLLLKLEQKQKISCHVNNLVSKGRYQLFKKPQEVHDDNQFVRKKLNLIEYEKNKRVDKKFKPKMDQQQKRVLDQLYRISLQDRQQIKNDHQLKIILLQDQYIKNTKFKPRPKSLLKF